MSDRDTSIPDDPAELSDTQAAIDAGVALAKPDQLEPGQMYGIVVPHGGRHHLVDLERSAAVPRRKVATYRPATVEAFSEVVERHEDSPRSTIWVHPTSGKIVAIFDDHSKDLPGWREHRAELVLQSTDEWVHWLSRDGNLISQREFAEHIEDGLPELVEPAAAEMLEIAQSFHAKSDVTFRSATRLQDGTVQAQYDEELDAQAGNTGQFSIPAEFKLAISPFLGEDPYRLTARLRYRVSRGVLSIGYKLERPDSVIRDCLSGIADKLADQHPLPVYVGEPGA